MSARPRNPFPTVDVVIELRGREGTGTGAPGADGPGPVVLVWRTNPPEGWVLPGGFVDYGETVEEAARREAAEETGLAVELVALIGVYSDSRRDARQHNLSTVFAARATGEPQAGDDAARVGVFPLKALPAPLCFDHALILDHYRQWRAGLRPAAPVQTPEEPAWTPNAS